ncbi:MAG TPA: gephyrin-like molybdotransferase Glp [Candidatus Dormibacteraeota bacterium]|nr:gephyrin-like molybdotransferase Glp [Candidatus Dormibacteraeota bacterium]
MEALKEAMLTVDEARRRLIGLVGVLPSSATPLQQAHGLVLAGGVTARRDLPGFDNSAMDGFAVRAADTSGASDARPARLLLTGEVAAGGVFPGDLRPGTAVRIMTGAPLPEGADAVIEVERTKIDADTVLVLEEVQRERSVRRAGDDIRRGDEALGSGAWLGPAQLALLAALGETDPLCHPRPRVAVIPTGDELVDPSRQPGPGQVADVVSSALPAAVVEAGGAAQVIARAHDTEKDVRRAFADARDADLVVTVGGVSMGEYDYVRRVIESDGELDFWRVAMRPGKPLAVGKVGGRPVVGLPGNPVSALVGFELYVLPAILAMSGRGGWSRPRRVCTLMSDISTPVGLRTFLRAVAVPGEGRLEVTPLPGQGSHQMRWMAAANALIDVAADVADVHAGQEVDAILIDRPVGPSPW